MHSMYKLQHTSVFIGVQKLAPKTIAPVPPFHVRVCEPTFRAIRLLASNVGQLNEPPGKGLEDIISASCSYRLETRVSCLCKDRKIVPDVNVRARGSAT